MKPAGFTYLAPRSLDEAVEQLNLRGDGTKLLAGGQSLVPLMNLRLVRPAALIDLNRVDELVYVDRDTGGVRIGAMTRHHTVATLPLVQDTSPLLSHAAGLIGYRAIRHRGTMGGSLAHADPASELPCIALTQGAEIEAASAGGSRLIPAHEFFMGHMTTAIDGGEVVAGVRFPEIGSDEGWGFREFARKAGDFAVVMVATVLRQSGGKIDSAGIGVGGVESRPLRATDAEAVLVGSAAGEAPVEAAAEAAAAAVDPVSDIHGSADYRRHLVRTLTRRALEDAIGRLDPDHG